jgi:hypothetical protein
LAAAWPWRWWSPCCEELPAARLLGLLLPPASPSSAPQLVNYIA